MKPLFEIINQISQLENKLKNQDEFNRHFVKCRQLLEEMGISYYWPLHEKYSETRTDVDAHITGNHAGNLTITQVIKPVIIQDKTIVQRGVVIVEGKE